MKTLKNMLLMIAIVILGSFHPATAQDDPRPGETFPDPAIDTYEYSTALGIRAGGTSGFTLKIFTGPVSAFEGILGVWPEGIGITLLYERHVYAETRGLYWYYGAGGHAVFSTEGPRYFRNGSSFERNIDEDMGLGIDGILGIEYKIAPIPFAVSFDLKPFVEVTNDGNTYVAIDPGLGIKLTF